MNSFHLPHLMFFLFFFTQLLVVAQGCYDNERIALLEFKSFLHDPSNLLSSWQEGHIHQNSCNWCSDISFYVISINLRDKYRANYINEYSNSVEFSPPNALLTGEISPFLFNLTYLEYLDLSSNDFQESPIPHQFSNLKNLTHLDISYSSFSGSITTEFNNLSSLRDLDLSCTSISYMDASSLNWLIGLHNLEILKLSGVDLSEASSSSFKNNFAEPLSYNSNLRVLDLSDCTVNISVLPEFYNHSRLSYLNLNGYNTINSQIHIPRTTG